MGDFNLRIKRKKETDENLMNSALGNILKIFDSKSGTRYDVCAKNETEREIGHILKSMGIPAVDIPDNIGDDESAVTYVMSVTGISRRKIVLQGEWWKNGTLALLCVNDEGKFTALISDIFGNYQYVDEKTGLLKKVTKEYAKRFSETAYCFYKPFDGKKITCAQFLKSLLKSFSAGDVVFLAILSLVIGILGLVMPVLNQIVFDEIIPSGTMSDIFGIAAALIGVAVITPVFSFTRSAWMMRIGNKMQVFACNAVWSRVFRLPTDFFSKYEAGELVTRAEAATDICSILNRSIAPVFLTVLFSFIYLFQIMMFGAELFVPAAVIVVCLVISVAVTGFLKCRRFESINEASGKLSSFVFQAFSGISKIKTVGAEIRVFSKWAQLYSKSDVLPHIYIQLSSAVNSAIEFCGIIVLYITAKNAGITASSYIAFNVAFGALLASVMELSYITDDIALIRPLLDMIRPIIETETENSEPKAYVDKLSGKIEINQVSFRYAKDLPLVLDELTLNINAGEYIAITGSSGCGKSTLMRILMGFEKPEKGGVYYDDRNFDGLDVHSVRQRMGVVLQNGKLFAGDIYSNIVICAPWKTIDDAWAAAEKAGFADDIRAMPMGMYTMISDGGGGISGGQQQRLLIARALVSEPDILMFDEATSALDNITQKQVVDTLESMDITRIVIAHRLSTIKKCSRIIYMHKGKIAEMGTYDELMELDGMFADMAKRQLT